MAFGDFFGNMGNVAIGMQEGELVRGRIRQQNLQAERDASDIRQRQEQEAWLRNRRAESDRESMQFSAGTLPAMNSVPVQAIPNEGGGAAAPATAQPSGGSGKTPPAVTGTSYDEDIKVYEEQLRGVNSNLAAIDASRAPRPAGPTVDDGAGGVYTPETGRKFLMTPEESQQYRDLKQQKAGYEQGLKQYKDLQRKSAMQGGTNPTGATPPSNPDAARIGSILSKFPKASPAVTPELVAAIKGVENKSGNPNAVSPKGAFGVMQTMPGTFNDMSRMYFEGKLDPKNAQHQEMAGIAYLNHLATVELPRRGIEPTPRNIASAYQQGAQGLSKNGVSAGVSDGITNNAQYTDRVMAGVGGAPAGQQAPQAGATPAQNFAPVGQAEAVVSQQQYDLAMMQLKSRFSSLERLKRNTFDPTEKAKISAMQDEINMSAQDMQVQRLGSAAMANPQALQQLTGMFASRMGTPIAIQQDGRGNGRLVTPDGKPLAGAWGQVQPLKNIVSSMTESISPSLSAARTQDSNTYSKAYWEMLGRSQGQQNLEISKINATGAQAALAEEIKGNYHLQTEMAKAGLDANKIKRIEFNPDGKGGYVVATSDHLFEVNPGKPNALGMPTRPTVRVVNGIGNG